MERRFIPLIQQNVSAFGRSLIVDVYSDGIQYKIIFCENALILFEHYITIREKIQDRDYELFARGQSVGNNIIHNGIPEEIINSIDALQQSIKKNFHENTIERNLGHK